MPKVVSNPLLSFYNINNYYEIGIDECARGPMFGRLYVSAVILPKDDSFNHSLMKDSKKIHSHKKMRELSDYIKKHALYWHIHYIEAETIDKMNIRQSVLHGMFECIKNILSKIDKKYFDKIMVIVDGNDFKPYMVLDDETNTLTEIPHTTIEKADGTYSFVAAASILAKNAHDEYILDLCEKYPDLKTRYSLHENVGYGTAKHLQGIQEHGISQWHRKTFGCCKNARYNPIEENNIDTSI